MLTRFWARPTIRQGIHRTRPWMALLAGSSLRGAWASMPSNE